MNGKRGRRVSELKGIFFRSDTKQIFVIKQKKNFNHIFSTRKKPTTTNCTFLIQRTVMTSSLSIEEQFVYSMRRYLFCCK